MKEEIKRDYYTSGPIMNETPYINEKEHGLVRGWHENGQLWYEIPYKNDFQKGAKIQFRY